MNPSDFMRRTLHQVDPDVYAAIEAETARQSGGLELIASENFVSDAVLEAMGSVFTNKYAEGYPGKRYYGGCEHADTVERLALERAKQLFGADHANVQPHSGSQANMAVYLGHLKPGDTVLGMNLSHGGHLTHGHPLNYSGLTYRIISYGVERDSERLDYAELERLARAERPRLIVVGASAYSRIIDFERVRRIADAAGAAVMADIAHIAGLIVAGLHPSAVPHAEYVTTTTHKTLRGPRGGLVLCRAERAKELDRALFPGVQGGPLVHIIAAKAVCFREALEPSFVEYQRGIVANAAALAQALQRLGFRLVSGGTDNHLVLVDVFRNGITGKRAEELLGSCGITVNKNTIPYDTNKPAICSGIRLGTPALTTRGMGPDQMEAIAELIARVLLAPEDQGIHKEVLREVELLCERFPLYAHRLSHSYLRAGGGPQLCG